MGKPIQLALGTSRTFDLGERGEPAAGRRRLIQHVDLPSPSGLR